MSRVQRDLRERAAGLTLSEPAGDPARTEVGFLSSEFRCGLLQLACGRSVKEMHINPCHPLFAELDVTSAPTVVVHRW